MCACVRLKMAGEMQARKRKIREKVKGEETGALSGFSGRGGGAEPVVGGVL